jgi:hypothetical protein
MMQDLQTSPSLNIVTILEINLPNKSELNAIIKALMPDNVNFPSGLSMKMRIKDDNILFFEFFCNCEIEKLTSTIDEILNHISIARKVISHA